MATAVNDIHSQLNETFIDEVAPVESLESIRGAVTAAARADKSVAIAAGRHAMGGQQFCSGGVLFDTRPLARVLGLDEERGTVEVEAGVQWPAVIDAVAARSGGRWAIAQKQTGADRLSIGGAIAANVHGRGLAMRPFVSDLQSFVLVGPDGDTIRCSRDENEDLFRLVVGGYGLFGCVYSATIALRPRQLLERVVELRVIDEMPALFEERIRDGFLYGDFQFATDPGTDDFLRRGVFSCYRPTDRAHSPPPGQKALSPDDWQRLLYLAHAEKTRAFEEYARHYVATSGQLYWSDAHQLAEYLDGYHEGLDRLLGAHERASEMISEVYVPRDRLPDLMAAVADDFRANGVDVIYGTVRLIERDDESFLAWAKERFACVIFNLHTVHTDEGIRRSADDFRRLIDLAIERGGSYFLTYHRWARRDQVEACYPQLPEFLRRKREHDPDERFQSDWYRHYRSMFADDAAAP